MQATNRDRLMLLKKRVRCAGCYDDHYNRPGNSTTGFCWHLKSARLVKRFALGFWTRPTEPYAFSEVKVLNCYHENGQGKRVFSKTLPYFVDRRRVIWLAAAQNERARKSLEKEAKRAAGEAVRGEGQGDARPDAGDLSVAGE
jgi:hypothetical protein